MIVRTKIPISYIWHTVRKDMTIIFVFVVTIALLAKFSSGFLPDLVVAIPALLGTAISIMLSFRVSQSYGRWWEARKIWSAITNDSRSFVLQITSFIPSGNETLIERMAYRQIAFCFALSRSLRKQDPMENLDAYLTVEDLNAVRDSLHKPLAIMKLNTKSIKELKELKIINQFEHIQIDSTLVRIVSSMGGAERIKKTVFPVTYEMFLKYMLYIFLISLAISLKEVNMLYEIPLLMIVAAAFFLLEASAHQLQDPFEGRPTDTNMTSISETIELNIREVLGEVNINLPKDADLFYQL